MCFLLTVGGADPRNCQQRPLRAQKVQTLLPAQHPGPDLRHCHGWCPFHALPAFLCSQTRVDGDR